MHHANLFAKSVPEWASLVSPLPSRAVQLAVGKPLTAEQQSIIQASTPSCPLLKPSHSSCSAMPEDLVGSRAVIGCSQARPPLPHPTAVAHPLSALSAECVSLLRGPRRQPGLPAWRLCQPHRARHRGRGVRQDVDAGVSGAGAPRRQFPLYSLQQVRPVPLSSLHCFVYCCVHSRLAQRGFKCAAAGAASVCAPKAPPLDWVSRPPATHPPTLPPCLPAAPWWRRRGPGFSRWPPTSPAPPPTSWPPPSSGRCGEPARRLATSRGTSSTGRCRSTASADVSCARGWAVA